MTAPSPSRNSASVVSASLVAGLAVIAIAIAIIALVSDVASLSLAAAVVCAVLAAFVVKLNGAHSSVTEKLALAESEIDRLRTPPSDASATSDAVAAADPAAPKPDLADPVTGLPGGRYFALALEARVAAAKRHLRPVAVVLLEAVHDATGEQRPVDAVVFADVVRHTLRDADIFCRLESGRYAVLLEDTPEDGALWTVERIRRELDAQLNDVTVWSGAASYPAAGFDGPEVLDRARVAIDTARADWGPLAP